MSAFDYEEKRNFRRMALDCPIAYRSPDSATPSYGSVRDLSATGLSFSADQPQTPGAPLEIHIEPGSARIRPLRALIEVIRCQPLAGGGYEIAAKIRAFRD